MAERSETRKRSDEEKEEQRRKRAFLKTYGYRTNFQERTNLYTLVYGKVHYHYKVPHPPGWDHAQWFIDALGVYRYVIQPYLGAVGSEEEFRAESEEFARTHGLLVRVSASESWHRVDFEEPFGNTILAEYRLEPGRDMRQEKAREFVETWIENRASGFLDERQMIAVYQRWALRNFGGQPREVASYLESQGHRYVRRKGFEGIGWRREMLRPLAEM